MIHPLLSVAIVYLLAAEISIAQTAKNVPSADTSAVVQKATQQAETGVCAQAVPALRKALPRLLDKKLKYRAAMAAAQCAMSLGQRDAVFEMLALLHREFPHDPQVLYITAHYCGQLAGGAAQELAANPTSVQAQELDAEGYEANGKWDQAVAEYKKILEQHPGTPAIHYRLGRIILNTTPANVADARREFEEELKINPRNAAAEFLLGDIARQQQQWDEAIKHFSQAAQLDAGFAEAYLGLGMMLNSARRHAEAIAPLEKYVKMAPDDPAAHYQLALAYSRTGRKEDAAREMALQRQLDEKANQQRPAAPPPQ